MQLIQIVDCKAIHHTIVVVWLEAGNYWQIGGRVEPVLFLWGIKEEECLWRTVPKITMMKSWNLLNSCSFFYKFVQKVWLNVDLFKGLTIIGNSGSIESLHRKLRQLNFLEKFGRKSSVLIKLINFARWIWLLTGTNQVIHHAHFSFIMLPEFVDKISFHMKGSDVVLSSAKLLHIFCN